MKPFRLFRALRFSATCLVSVLLVIPARAQIGADRFASTVHGGLRIAGNTLGLSGTSGSNAPGTVGSIGTFLTTDSTQVDGTPSPGWPPGPPGTTASWSFNSSRAPLDLPGGVIVLHAELLWGGSYDYGTESVAAFLDTSVDLAFEGGASLSVAPDPGTAATLSGLDCSGFQFVNYYSRSADVTTFVASHGAGQYTVGAVPGTQDHAVSSSNAVGWCLLVAYENPAEPLRHLAIRVGADYIADCQSREYSFNGFTTPSAGSVEARILLAALEGDAFLGGDDVLVSNSGGAFSLVATSNNPPGNFFASQINDSDGLLVTSGTAGTLNHDALGQSNVSAGRQGWDITGATASQALGQIDHGQVDLSVRTQSVGDDYVLMAVGLAIDTTPPTDITLPNAEIGPVRLDAVFPNPFVSETTFRYSLAGSGSAHLRVFDAAGRLVRTLRKAEKIDGTVVSRWDGRDKNGREVAAGVYLIVLETDRYSTARTVTRIR